MTDIRQGIKDLQFFARHTKGIVDMIPYLENANRLESEVEQNAARNQKLQVEIEEAKTALAGFRQDIEEALEGSREIFESGKRDYDLYMKNAETGGNKVVAAANKKAADIAKKSENNQKEAHARLKDKEKALQGVKREVKVAEDQLFQLQSKLSRIKEAL